MLRLVTFGGLRLERDGAPCLGPAAQRRRLALLALLAGHRQGLTRDKLVAYLWPESDAQRARHSLDDALSALRRELQDEELFQGVATLTLNPSSLTCDQVDFAAALAGGDQARAVALYGGPFLDGFHLSDAPDFERWVDAERARAATAYGGALASLASTAASRQAFTEATQWWRKAITADPLSTRAALGLMRALAASGDRAEALRVADLHASLMRQDLELEPGPEFASVVADLRRAGAAASASTTTPTTFAAPVAAGVGPSTALPAASVEPAAEPRRPSGRAVRIGIGFVGVLVVSLAAWRLATHSAAPDRRRIAVARLQNATGDPRFDALGALAADAIGDGLAATGLTVVNSGLARSLARPDAAAPDIDSLARARGAGTVVTGSIYLQGDTLRLQASIADARSGQLLRSIQPALVPVVRPADAAPIIAERVRAAMATLLDERLASWTGATSQPANYDAYLEYVAARSAWPDYRRALGHMRRAVELDSTFALAHVNLVVAYRMVSDCSRVDSADRAVRRRFPALAPYDRLMLAQMEASCRNDLTAMLQITRQLVRVAPESPAAAYSLSLAYMQLLRVREAVAVLDRFGLGQGGSEIGPTYYLNLARALHLAERDQRSREVAAQGRQQFPDMPMMMAAYITTLMPEAPAATILAAFDTLSGMNDPIGGFYGVENAILTTIWELQRHGRPQDADRLIAKTLDMISPEPQARARRWLKANLLYAARRWSEARATFESLAAQDTANPDFRGGIGVSAARLGDRATAERMAAWLEARDTPSDSRPPAWRVRIYALLGERDRAVEALRVLMARGWLGHGELVHGRVDLAGLEGYTPLEDLLRVQR